MSISTQISSYLIPRAIWESGYGGASPLALPARDALDIERRWQKDVTLRNESRRYTLCCERMQGIARDLEINHAPIEPPAVWPSAGRTQGTPGSLAYLAMFGYLRKSYKPSRQGLDGLFKRVSLRYDRVEAIFQPPGKYIVAYHTLLGQILREARLGEMCAVAVEKSEVLSRGFKASALECKAALDHRYALVTKCTEKDFGLIDVFDLV